MPILESTNGFDLTYQVYVRLEGWGKVGIDLGRTCVRNSKHPPHSYIWAARESDPIIYGAHRRGVYHIGPSFNTGTEKTKQVSKFKRIGFEKMADFDGGEP